MTSRTSMRSAGVPTAGVSRVLLRIYKMPIKGAWLTEYLQQRGCNGVMNILNIPLLMNYWLTQPYPAEACTGNVSGIDMQVRNCSIVHVFDSDAHPLACT